MIVAASFDARKKQIVLTLLKKFVLGLNHRPLKDTA
jgi:hypothetical protein